MVQILKRDKGTGMKILVTGGKGMLGRTLIDNLTSRGHEAIAADLPETDILDAASLERTFATFKPDAAVHCAAMTKVDDCETMREKAFRLNRDGSAATARACLEHGAKLIAISTDYVFAGDAPESHAYSETDKPAPKTVYGQSKLAGEEAVLSILPDATILRIAWLYGRGGPSFVHTMVSLGKKSGAPLKVVDDQRGNPTSCDAVADEIAFLLQNPHPGVIHGTCEGTTTWYGFTKEIFQTLHLSREIVPCTTAEFPRPAPRPANSALSKDLLRSLGFEPRPWRDALNDFLVKEKFT